MLRLTSSWVFGPMFDIEAVACGTRPLERGEDNVMCTQVAPPLVRPQVAIQTSVGRAEHAW